MRAPETFVESVEYLVALVLPESREVLAILDLDGYRLPAVDIVTWSRPAEQLQQAIKARWGVSGIVLDFLQSLDRPQACVVVEVLVPNRAFGRLRASRMRMNLRSHESSRISAEAIFQSSYRLGLSGMLG
jgi:hypothetical protein